MSYPENRPIRDSATAGLAGGVFLLIVGVFLLVAALVGSFVWLHAEGHFISQQTQNQRHSIGFVQGHNRQILEDITAYDDAKTRADQSGGNPQLVDDASGQAANRLHDICQLAGEIDLAEQTAPVRSFLRAHPC